MFAPPPSSRRTTSLGSIPGDEFDGIIPRHTRKRSSDNHTACRQASPQQSTPQASLMADTKLSLAKWFRDRLLGGKTLHDMCPAQDSSAAQTTRSSSHCSGADSDLPTEELRKSYSTDCLPSRERLDVGKVLSTVSVSRALEECLSERPVSVGVVGSHAEAIVDSLVSAGTPEDFRFLTAEVAADLDAMDVDEETAWSATCLFQYSKQAEMIVQFKHASSFANPAYVDEVIRPVLGRALRYTGEGLDERQDRELLQAKLGELRSSFGTYIENCVVRLPTESLRHDRELVYFGGLQRARSEQAIQAFRRTNCLVCTVEEDRGFTHNLRGFIVTSGYLQKLLRAPGAYSLFVLVCPSRESDGASCFEELKATLLHQIQQLLQEYSPTGAAANVADVMARVRIMWTDPQSFLDVGPDCLDSMLSDVEQRRSTGVPALVASITNLTLLRGSKAVERIPEELLNNNNEPKCSDTPLRGAKVEHLASSLQQRLTVLRESLASKKWLQLDASPSDQDQCLDPDHSWRTSLLRAVPKQIEGVLAASTELFQEFLVAAQETDGADLTEKTVKEVRLRRLQEFCETVRQRTAMRASVMQRALMSSSSEPGSLVESSLSQVQSMEYELQHSAKLMMIALRASPQVLQGGHLAAMMSTKRQLLHQLNPADSNSWSAVTFRPRDAISSLESPQAWSLSKAHAVEANDPRRPLDIASGHKLVAQQQQMQEVLECVGLRVADSEQIPRDERSLSCSLAYLLYGSSELSSVVLHMVMGELLEHRYRYEDWFCDGLSLDEYVAHLAWAPRHGDYVQLIAAAEHYGASIFVYCPRYSSPLVFRSHALVNGRVGGRVLRLACLDGLHFTPVEAAELPVPMKRKRSCDVDPVAAATTKRRLEEPEVPPAPIPKVPSTGVKMQSSLADMCIASAVDNIDLLPSLSGSLPFELVQKLITACIDKGTLTDSVLQRLLSGSQPDRLDLSGYPGGGRVLAKLLEQCGGALQKLSLKGATLRSADVLLAVASSCPQLRELDLRHCYPLDSAALAHVTSRCSRLESVRFSNCDTVNDGHVASLLQNCPCLAVLQLKGCPRVSDEGLDGAPGSGVHLQELDLRGTAVSAVCVEATVAAFSLSLRSLLVAGVGMGDGVAAAAAACRHLRLLCMVASSVSDAGVADVAYGCAELRQLRLPYSKELTSFALQQFRLQPRPSNHVPMGDLRVLDITRCLAMTDDAVLSLLSLRPPLEVVNLSSCEDITDAATIALVRQCGGSLVKLNVSKCPRLTDDALLAVAASCSLLEEVRFYNCPGVTDASVQELGKASGRLRVVDASSCEHVSDAGLVGLASACPRLETLCLEESSVSDEGLLAVFASCRLLRTVKLAYCANITDRSISRLASLSAGLRVLDLSHSNQVSMRAIRRVLALCPCLRELNLRGYNHISGQGFSHSALAVLNLSWCKNLQDSALVHVARGCPSLSHLDLAWCDRVTRAGVLLLARECPSLRHLNVNGCSGLSVPVSS